MQLEINLEIPREAIRAGFEGKRRAVDRAIDRAIRKTSRWLSSKLRKEVAAKANIPQKHLKNRSRTKVYKAQQLGVVWLGTNPIGAHLVGNPRQIKKGTRVGRKHFFESAFFARVYGKHQKIYRRKFRGPGSSRKGKGDGRFPVEVMTIELDDLSNEAAKQLEAEARNRFHRTLAQEINYATNVEKRR